MDFIKLARNYKDEMISELITLMEIQSTLDEKTSSKDAPFGKSISEAMKFMLQKGQQNGFAIKDIDGYAARISLGHQESSVSLLGHLDVVPGHAEQFKPFIKDGFLVGRGALDDKGPTMAAFYAMKILKDLNVKFKHRIDLIVGGDEETHMRCMAYYKEHEDLPLMGYVPDAEFPGVFAEKGILNFDIVLENKTVIKNMNAGTRPNIVIEKAQAQLKHGIQNDSFEFYLRSNNLEGTFEETNLEMIGKAYHASIPYKGNNAGVHLINYIAAETNDDFLLKLAEALRNPFGLGLGVDYESAQMEQLTMNVGIISIDENEIRITLDIRYPNELTAQDIIEKIESKLNSKLQNISDSEPHYIDPASSLVTTALNAYQKVTNDFDSKVTLMGGGTYARTLPNHIAFGADFPRRYKPDWVGGPHEKNEAVEIESLVLATAIYAEALVSIAELEE